MSQPRCRLCSEPITSAAFSVIDAPNGAQSFEDEPEVAATIRTTLDIAECAACGLVQSLSPTVPYFRQAISAAGLSAGMLRYRTHQFSAFVEAHSLSGKRVFEAGCGKGDLLPILGATGAIPVGVEYEGAQPAGGKRVFPITDDYPEGNLPLAGSPYAAFICLNFLEHAPFPRDFLGGLRASLDTAGVGLLEVPNYVRQRSQGRAFDYVADHLSYFTPRTLRLVIELSGFEVRQLDETRDGENIEAWVRLRTPLDFKEDKKRIEDSRHSLAQLLREKGGGIAVWGASHQALTLLSGLPRHAVRAIIDSAPFKQGKYAPGSGVPVIAPTPAAIGQFDHVIIIAAGYEKEIAMTLSRDLGFRGTIWKFDGGDIKIHE